MDPGAPVRPRGPWLLLLWSAVLMASASASTRAGHTVQAAPGSQVLLQCEAPEGTDLENVVLEWTRSDQKQSYVFLFRDGRPLLDHQHRHFTDRVELVDPTLRSGDLSITLGNIGPSDSGLYSCHVFSHSHAKKRSVVGTKPITTIDLRVGPDRSLEVFSRTDVILEYEAPDGTDLENMAVEWTRSNLDQKYVFLFRDGRPLLDYQHRDFRDRVELIDPTLRSGNLSIRLRDVSRSDSGLYTCHVRSHAHIRKRSVLRTPPIRTIDLNVTGPEPKTVEAFPGQNVVLPAAETNFNVTSVMWRREDEPDKFVFQSGLSGLHNQHPQYSGRTELRNQTQDQDRLRDLSVVLRGVQPSDSGTYHAHIVQSQQRMKRDLHQSEPYSVVILNVKTSGALRLEAGVGFMAAVLFSLLLQI